MSKKFLLFFLLVVGIVMLTGCVSKDSNQQVNNNQTTTKNSANASSLMSQAEIAADKIEVVHFHGTQQCWSCIMVGEYALKTVKEKFPEEYANGMIIFREINGELPANRDTVIKYQARGSSLFINTVINGQDNIEEDITVWRLITNEKQFMSYFENKLNKLLGKPH